MENWVPINSFPRYEISDHGSIRNGKTDRCLRLRLNPRGHLQVSLSDKGEVLTRSVAKLVLMSFEGEPAFRTYTPLHRDGNVRNNFLRNLEWRPRWFVLEYQAQVKREEPMYQRPLVDMTTSIEYHNALQAADAIGGLEKHVHRSAMSYGSYRHMGHEFTYI